MARMHVPGTLKDLGQHQHRHIAAQSVAPIGKIEEDGDHRILQGGIGIVELQSVAPTIKIRIAAMSKDLLLAIIQSESSVVLRRGGDIVGGALYEIIGMLVDPGMVESHVVRDKIEHQSCA